MLAQPRPRSYPDPGASFIEKVRETCDVVVSTSGADAVTSTVVVAAPTFSLRSMPLPRETSSATFVTTLWKPGAVASTFTQPAVMPGTAHLPSQYVLAVCVTPLSTLIT